jgi:hypothetical protein
MTRRRASSLVMRAGKGASNVRTVAAVRHNRLILSSAFRTRVRWSASGWKHLHLALWWLVFMKTPYSCAAALRARAPRLLATRQAGMAGMIALRLQACKVTLEVCSVRPQEIVTLTRQMDASLLMMHQPSNCVGRAARSVLVCQARKRSPVHACLTHLFDPYQAETTWI